MLIALARRRASVEQKGDDLGATEERCPTESNGIVLFIRERNVRTVLEKELCCSDLTEFRGNVKWISSPRIRFTQRIRQARVFAKEHAHAVEIATFHRTVQCAHGRHRCALSRRGSSFTGGGCFACRGAAFACKSRLCSSLPALASRRCLLCWCWHGQSGHQRGGRI